jgi:cellulose synthase (UDP-forming)
LPDEITVQWIDAFYSPFPSLVVSVSLLAAVCLLSWWGTGRKLALLLCILLFGRYMLWRGLYTLNFDGGLGLGASLVLFLAETSGFLQFLFFAYQAWSPTHRESPPIETYPSVDILVPVVGEPLYILERTLTGCIAQSYPKDSFKVYVLDDGPREEVRSLADQLGVVYLSRADRKHAKAGNVNNALEHSSGELVAFFDVDHVPSSDFLEKTVGFFADEDVALVQTAQGFYNKDIFQRSVARDRTVHNEQELFFRVLQAGRDRHNSAFFAGSSGVLRRTALEEIGGFKTETITEDLHTSVVLHAKGFKSVYLNEVLAWGLMPEDFEAHIRQRARWATGTSQVLVRDNPLFLSGLSWSQRFDYLGSIHFFWSGLPRIIFLIAPLAWLLFSIPALRAEAGELINFFFSAYAASLLANRMVSGNTRNAFWSDVYETVMCFAVTRAALVGLLSGSKQRRFEVTPKGRRFEKTSFASFSVVGGHLLVFGLLIFGVTMGAQEWFGPSPTPGLGISLWWGAFNVMLLTTAVIPAREQPQLRHFIRRFDGARCLILDGSKQIPATILDVNESGAAIRIRAPMYVLEKHIRIAFKEEEDELLTLKGTIVRQDLEQNGEATVGVQFEDLDERATRALIGRSFTPMDPQPGEATPGGGVLASLWSVLSVLSRVGKSLRPSNRRMPRLPLARACELRFEGNLLAGTTVDVSFAGVSVAFPGSHEVRSQACVLSIDDVELAVSPIESVPRGDETLVRFRVETIAKGEPTWQHWHQSSSC